MVLCEECDEPCKRRSRCKHCGELACGYCLHHFHRIHVTSGATPAPGPDSEKKT